MRLSDPRVEKILQWWREQPFWNKCLLAISHPSEWMSVTSLDKADRKACQDMVKRVFGQ